MIAVLKRSRFYDRKRPQGVDCAGCLHALVFSSACNIFSGDTSITSERKICQTFIAVHIYRLAYGGPCELPVKRGVHAHAAESVLVKHAFGRIAAGSTRHFITRCGVGLGERDHVVNARPAGSVVVAAFLWQLGREYRICGRKPYKCYEIKEPQCLNSYARLHITRLSREPLRDPTDRSISTPYLWRFACEAFFPGLAQRRRRLGLSRCPVLRDKRTSSLRRLRSAFVQVFGRRNDGLSTHSEGRRPKSAKAGNRGLGGLSTHSDGRRPKSAKAGNRGLGTAVVPQLWGFRRGRRRRCGGTRRQGTQMCHPARA